MSNSIIAEYIWLDKNKNPRSKARTLNFSTDSTISIPTNAWPKWTYDGSSTGQASEEQAIPERDMKKEMSSPAQNPKKRRDVPQGSSIMKWVKK